MNRNYYDNDITTWSPHGRIFQIEYAMEAVKQGSCAVGVKSKEVAILLALKRASSELSAHQKKVFRIDDHIGIAIAGLTSDARVLSRFMRNECLNSKFAYDDSLPVSRLVSRVSARTQVSTQRYGRRPYGVGLLVAGYDDQGPHVYQTCPSANFYDCKAMAIGARSQSARTYLERNFDKFPESSLEELVLHGLYALRESLPQNTDLSAQNTAIAVVGKDLPFNELSEEETGRYLEKMGEDRRSKRTGDVLKEADEGGDAGTSGEPGEGGESQ
eukprot:Clim_evm85s243 gene=Clim_evmTU85s243